MGRLCYQSMASAITGAVRTGVAKAGVRNCSVLVRYQGAKGGLGPKEVAEKAHGAQLTTDWRKYSGIVAVGVAGLMVIEGFIHLSHDHHSAHSAKSVTRPSHGATARRVCSALKSTPPKKSRHHQSGCLIFSCRCVLRSS